MPDFSAVIPEIIILAVGCLALMVSVFVRQHAARATYWLVQIGLIVAFVFTWLQYQQPALVTFDGSYIIDPLATITKLVILMAGFFTFIYSYHYVEAREIPGCEFYILGVFSILGMMVLVSGYNFLTLYLGLELMSLPLYAMVAMWRKEARCSEAAIKYFVIGALASGMLLYGLSMLYGATGSIEVPLVAKAIGGIAPAQRMVLAFGIVFVVAGLAFKLGAVPFHMWVPDVYEGAPTATTLFIGAAPKIAAFVLLIRLLVDATPALHSNWHQLLIAVAVLSMALGNFAAIVQTNLKRLFAYSSIAHMGYMLLGVIAGTAAGYAASLFYITTYVLMTLVGFGMILMLSRAGFEADNIDDFHGLNSRSPWLALMFMLVLFSMGGIPPLVGFIAKVGVLEALIHVHLEWLAVLAVIFAIVGAYYYIRVIKVMYFEEPHEMTTVTSPISSRVAITINGLAVLGFGILPGFLYAICHAAFH